MKKHKWLIAIVVIGAALRLVGLGKNPPGLYWDEVSLGWNAYSILKTGMDEHGRFFPLDTFYAFGDYKPPAYIYAAVPSIALFGLNEFAVRLPSALAGIALVLIAYLLVRELFARTRHFSDETDFFSGKKSQSRPNPVVALFDSAHGERGAKEAYYGALLAALLVAISPWSVTLSRVAFESNLAVLFNALGFLFFLYAVKRSPKWLALSVFCFVLASYTFNANRLLSPLFLVVLTLVYSRKALKHWKWWVCSAALGLAMVSPMIAHLWSPQGKLRWDEVNIFSTLSVIELSNSRKEIDHNSLLSKIFHHRYLGYAGLFLRRYFDHFNLNYLFLDGDPNPRINVPGIGELYLVELPFFIIGLISLMRPTSLIKSRGKFVILLWLFLAPLPASLARETPHALRSASILPVPQVIVALGLMSLISLMSQMSQTRRIKSLLFAFCFLLFLSLAHFQFIYYRYYPYEWAQEWMTSYPRLVRYVRSIRQPNQIAYITPDLGRPYIYFLFYTKYPPEQFIKDADVGGRTGDAFGFFSVNSFGPYRFFIPDLTTIPDNSLVVTRADPPPEGFALLKTITDINGYPQFNVIKR